MSFGGWSIGVLEYWGDQEPSVVSQQASSAIHTGKSLCFLVSDHGVIYISQGSKRPTGYLCLIPGAFDRPPSSVVGLPITKYDSKEVLCP